MLKPQLRISESEYGTRFLINLPAGHAPLAKALEEHFKDHPIYFLKSKSDFGFVVVPPSGQPLEKLKMHLEQFLRDRKRDGRIKVEYEVSIER
jgi:hypothetical protein